MGPVRILYVFKEGSLYNRRLNNAEGLYRAAARFRGT